MTVPMAEQVACAERELRLRRRGYPRMIEAGRMTPQAAESELLRMAAIVETLRILEERERLL
jgi:hypothetical protein